MKVKSKALGLCIGASSIKLAEVFETSAGCEIGRTLVVHHECDTRGGVLELLNRFRPRDYDNLCVTGRKFKDLVNLPSITEPEASEYALRFVQRRHEVQFQALLSLGSESFILYQIDHEGSITAVNTGNKCASGTGEFFLQQIRRMDLSLEEACRAIADAEPYRVSGRCSVFCKSDCTHALNKGIPRGRVGAGLGNMIAEKALEILGALPRESVLAVGGVTRNSYVMGRLEKEIRSLVAEGE